MAIIPQMKCFTYSIIITVALFSSRNLAAQMIHEHGGQDTIKAMPSMKSITSISLTGHRDGSGTSWIPDRSPVRAIHAMAGSWPLMIHGSIFLRYSNQNFNNSDMRGGDIFDAPNWMMLM